MILSIVLGLASARLGESVVWLSSVLVVLGIVVGFLNISGRESKDFLWVTLALVVVAYAGGSQVSTWDKVSIIGPYLKGVFEQILAFVIPSSVVVALKETWAIAKGSQR